MDIVVLVERTQGELLQLRAFIVHNIEKIVGVLEPHALQTVRGSEITEDSGWR